MSNRQNIQIICTQPREFNAITVAQRVASERDEKVGYVIGYKTILKKKMSSNTRLLFCTIDILLQKFSNDPLVKSITHIIVDEVQERSAER